jgi:hypothetical protein
MGQWTASTTAGLRFSFIKDQIASGQLPTVVLVPGFVRVHADALENWYEELSSECLTLNENPHKYPFESGFCGLRANAYNWLQNYAHAITTHAVKTGYLIAASCASCGNPESHAHHPSYDTPLRAIWLCKRCHPIHHHRLWAALKLVAETGRPAQLELFPRSKVAGPKGSKISPELANTNLALRICSI